MVIANLDYFGPNHGFPRANGFKDIVSLLLSSSKLINFT
jgi:hypothetical protein